MSLLTRARRANRPGPPEDSVALRLSTAGAVAVGIWACHAVGELAPGLAVAAIGLVLVGNWFSYVRRARPVGWLKIVLAAVVVVAFVWFFVRVTAHSTTGSILSVEGPLAVLFTCIQAAHAFDVPSRRDLGFSLAGSTTLMAVAAAQAVDVVFGAYVVAWAACGLIALATLWASMAGGAAVRPGAAAAAGAAVLAVGLLVVAVLPAPHASTSVVFPSSLAGDAPLGPQGAVVDGGRSGAEPARAATSSGATRIGGYLGFAGPLDTAIRGSLGDQTVLRVRADHPSYWIAETFDHWDGQSWGRAPIPDEQPVRQLTGGPPFAIPPPSTSAAAATGSPDIQTFYLAEPGPNVILHAANATEVWFPAHRLFVRPDGSIVAGTTMGPGSIYTVASDDDRASADELRHATPDRFRGSRLPAAQLAAYTELPHPYARVTRLATRVTAGAPTLYAKVTALEGWIGAHTRYTTDIPPLRPGQDTVTQFLFGNRRGYCEQISTSLAVMLRSLGIPAREATGYVPGSFDPLTDLYQVKAKDAHAWVQVWFPGYGWQSFDPTAVVATDNPSAASVLAHDATGALGQVPVVPTACVLAALALLAMGIRWRRRAPATWAGTIGTHIERAARRAGVPDRPDAPLTQLAARLDQRLDASPPRRPRRRRVPPGAARALDLAAVAEQAAFGHGEPDALERRALLHDARRLRRRAWRARRLRTGDGAGGRAGRRRPATPARAPAPDRRAPPPPAAAGTTSAGADDRGQPPR